jgi:hypothetical protein
MATLIDLEVAKDHLNVTDPRHDLRIERMVTQAQAIVLEYIARSSDTAWTATIAAWTEVTVPPVVQAAILLQLGELYRYRGDDEMPKRDEGDLAPGVKSLLRRYRDPVIA